ncbi:MAG: SDR family NAD(P)-dependent oxidoreductase [Aquisalimonadaceae bacterium]
MSNELAVVTGGGTGLGRSICHALADRGLTVLTVGRRSVPLEETRAHAPELITALAADVATRQGRDAIVDAVGERRLRALVHNAGVIEPIGPLAEVRLEDWRHSQAVNVEAPLFLTQALLDRLPGGRILHISSGAAHKALAGWGAYCTSKAALYMLYQTLGLELADRDVGVGSFRPGVVDTPMQTLIRRQSASEFPAVQQFVQLHSSGSLADPGQVADFAAWLLLDVSADRYGREEWSFTEPAHRAQWGG